MMEPGKDASLGEKTLLQQFHVPVVERERLERVVDAQLLVDHLVDGAHAATADEADDAIDPDAGIWRKRVHKVVV